uniref:Single-stranded-DNA-specific exonuclease RecJ n=1 Tax=Caldilinea aerophila TaxID=133453 RepID=A0A7C1FIE6_9CHLR
MITPLPWILKPPITPSPELIAAVGGHPLVAQLLAQRGIDTPEKAIPFLDPKQYKPAPPSALCGVEEAATLLYEAIRSQRNILVWGDFDVDGQTSTALLVTALRMLGDDDQVRFHVPNRFEEGHGIRLTKLQEKLSEYPADVLLTCDTGIAEGAAIGYARDCGMTVIVTDHHDLSAEFHGLQPGVDPLWGLSADAAGIESVRRANAIVNPKFLPEGDPLRTLPGVGVAYKLVQRLFELAGRGGEEEEMLDLVALGIVADVAEQVNDARYLLQCGLEKLRNTRRVGLMALMEISRVDPSRLTAESIGFQLGPRMNALGRLDDATVSVELLSTRDPLRARQLASKLERLNQERRVLTSQITRSAEEMIERNPSLLDFNALVLAHPQWHAGVVGIVASRLVERYSKPAVLLLTPPGEVARGSARSAPGVDIGAAIAACSHLLIAHGGHPGAAGLSLLPENIDAFRRELSRQVELHRDPAVQPGLQIDAEVRLSELSLELERDVARLAPFGQGNPQPRFVTFGVHVVSDRRMGVDGSHRKLQIRPAGVEGPVHELLWFGGGDAELSTGALDVVYTLGVNDYRGERSLQLMYVAHRPAQPRIVEVMPEKAQRVQVVDLRRSPDPLPQLPAEAAWYAEGALLETSSPGVAYAPRFETPAQPGRPLVLWSTPPSGELLHWLVESSGCETVYLCARATTDDAPAAVIRDVARMAKYAVNRDHLIDIGRMAARLGQTEAVIRTALLLLEGRGIVRLAEWLDGDCARIEAGDAQAQAADLDAIKAEFEALLAEVRAYRRFVARARVEDLGIG